MTNTNVLRELLNGKDYSVRIADDYGMHITFFINNKYLLDKESQQILLQLFEKAKEASNFILESFTYEIKITKENLNLIEYTLKYDCDLGVGKLILMKLISDEKLKNKSLLKDVLSKQEPTNNLLEVYIDYIIPSFATSGTTMYSINKSQWTAEQIEMFIKISCYNSNAINKTWAEIYDGDPIFIKLTEKEETIIGKELSKNNEKTALNNTEQKIWLYNSAVTSLCFKIVESYFSVTQAPEFRLLDKKNGTFQNVFTSLMEDISTEALLFIIKRTVNGDILNRRKDYLYKYEGYHAVYLLTEEEYFSYIKYFNEITGNAYVDETPSTTISKSLYMPTKVSETLALLYFIDKEYMKDYLNYGIANGWNLDIFNTDEGVSEIIDLYKNKIDEYINISIYIGIEDKE